MGLFDRLFGPRATRSQQSTVEVVGIRHRRAHAEAFCLAVCAAQASRRSCGVRLRPESDNAGDRNAVAVDGFAGARSWHVGYLDGDMAEKISRDLFSKGIPVDARLGSIRIGHRGSIDIRIVVPDVGG